MTFGTVALILAGGFIEWLTWGMREGTIRSGLGHIQIVRSGFLDRGSSDPFAYLLPAASPHLREIEADPRVKRVSPRLKFSGLISRDGSTFSFLGTGLDAEKEAGIDNVSAIEGEPLSNGEREGVLIGRGLATNLGLSTGDTVVLLVNKKGGAVNGVDARVRGIFSTVTKAYDDVAVHVPLELAGELLGADGAHAWIVHLHRTDATASVVRDLRRLPLHDSSVVPWYDLADFYHKTVLLFSRQVLVMKIIIAMVVILTISNMMMTNVLQRTAETATAMALGLRRSRVLSRFILEGTLIGLLGGAAGVALGYASATVISQIGIPMPPPPGMARGLVGQILVTPPLVRDALWIACTTAALATLYPAWKASRMTIVEALRHAHAG